MATSTSGNDVIIVTIQRSCAKQLLLALTLALGGTPIRMVDYKKGGKGKQKGGGGKTTGKTTGKVTGKATSTSTKSFSSASQSKKGKKGKK